jgi:hypothetical protein
LENVFGVFQKKPAATGYVNAFMHTLQLSSSGSNGPDKNQAAIAP